MHVTREQLLDEAKALDPSRRAELVEDLRQITDDELAP